MLNSVTFCSDWFPNQTLSSSFAIRRGLCKNINFRSPWLWALVYFNFSSAREIHPTRDEKYRETPTSMSSIAGFYSSVLLFYALSTANDLHTRIIKITSRWRNRRLMMLTKFVKWNGQRLLVSQIRQIIDRAFKDEFLSKTGGLLHAWGWAVHSNTKCFEIIQLDNFFVRQSLIINFHHRVRAQNRS